MVVRHGVLHYGVGNIPAAVPHTSTYALTNATFPYAADPGRPRGPRRATEADPALAAGVLCASGQLTNEAVAEALGLPSVAVRDASGGHITTPAVLSPDSWPST